MNALFMDLEEFNKIPNHTTFRVTITKYHNDTEFGNPELMFIFRKSHGDWCIYYHLASKGQEFVEQQGQKVTSIARILSLLPCDSQVLQLYRF